ncbi:MAG: MFS transporter [Calditrichota bacterium]
MKPITQNPMFRFLVISTIATYVGLQGWRTLFNNFAVEVAHLEGNQIGIIQSVREIPGFLALFAVYLLLILKEHKLSAVSVLVVGIGMSLTGFFPSYLGLIFTTLILSFGFHYYETTNQSLTLQYFDKTTSPWVFGKLRSFAAASNIGVGLFILGSSYFLSYKWNYLVIGGAIIVAGLWGIAQDPSDKEIIPQHRKMIFRKKYWLFYLLTFLAGARRQIFVAFAVFLLVKKFEYSIQDVTILFVINNIINYFLSPLIGKAIIRYGERKVLSLEYFSLIFIFTAYAFIESKIIVALLYILDHIFYNFAIAIRTYFQKVGDPRDIAPSMAVGFTINHIAAVFVPAIGGILWMINYRITFLGGVLLSICSLAAVQKIPSLKK